MQVTPEICETAIARYVTPMFEARIADGTFGRRDGALVIATVTDDPEAFTAPDEAFRAANVVYEHTWGQTAAGSSDFSLNALQKVFGAWRFRRDYDQVLTNHRDFVTEHGLVAWPGALVRDVTPPLSEQPSLPLVVVGYSGLWYYHDALIAGQVLDGIRAELALRGQTSK